MKALLCRSLGGPETLEVAEIEAPVPGPGEIAIDVEGCGVNFADTLIIQGKYQVKPELPFSPGMEVAGRVAEVGEGVTGFSVGQPVIGMCGTGGYAERVVLEAKRAKPRPDGIDGVIAAAIPVAYGTAHLGLHARGCNPARRCWSMAPRAAWVSPLSRSASAWAPRSSPRHRARRSSRWRANTAPIT
jgi:NADPH:quinone reductase